LEQLQGKRNKNRCTRAYKQYTQNTTIKYNYPMHIIYYYYYYYYYYYCFAIHIYWCV